MKQLKSVTLSNIRRYGADTRIDLSEGATILLAPNGTGKTAFFEAIELSLTGNVSRLGANLSPIIRDSQTTAKVVLDFGDVQASAQVNSQGKVEQSGSLSSLFPGTNTDDIPFLLRLTHILDQREGEWLVKAESKAAGAQLARLPIGKDGTQVSLALGTIRRVLTDKLKQAKGTLLALETEYGEWQSLVLERDMAATQSLGALRSKENIAASISEIAHQTQSSDQLPLGLLVPPLGLDNLEALHAALEQTVQTKLNRLRDQISTLVEVDGLVGRFVSEQLRSEQLGNELLAARQVLAQKKEEKAQIAAALGRLQQEMLFAEGEREAIVNQLHRLNHESQTKDALEQHKQQLELADKSVREAESVASTLRRLHEGNEKLLIEHNLINNQLKALLSEEADLLAIRQLVSRWEESLQLIETNAATLKEQETLEGVLQVRLSNALMLKASAEKELLDDKQLHEALASTADSIRQSVASIATHLPDDRGDCPLCGAEHGVVELRKRILKSLEAIDPKVVEAEQRIKKSSDNLRTCVEAVAQAEIELTAQQNKRKELKSNEARLTTDINQIKKHILLDGDTAEQAKATIQRREESNVTAKLLLGEKQHNLAPPPAPDVLEASKTAFETAERTLAVSRHKRTLALASLQQSTATLAAIIAETTPSKTLSELAIDKNRCLNKISELSANVNAVKSALDHQEATLSESDNKVAILQKQITDAQVQLATIRSSWRQLSFAGDPAAEVANSKELQLQSSSADLSRHSEELQSLKIEISTWNKLERTRLTQGLMDRRRGKLSEEEFTAALQKRIETEKLGHAQLEKLSEAMETLNRCLSAEISNVQKHVLSVIPRWQSLLKRVVREQRFTDTKLDFRSLYRKEHAEVSVPLHGGPVPVPVIASEAQLTDLQLTFLLSMALEHQWSPWRCLLLDDPTQHHDLVHAASVFDLLRDYIVDHGFQVVIATHDALQARYFMRKLQNDGIDARLWSLSPTHKGVTASEVKIANQAVFSVGPQIGDHGRG